MTVCLVSAEHGSATWQDNASARILMEINIELPDGVLH